MDNSTTTWIMVALLLLLIGAAIFMLLRRPGGGDTAVDSRDDSAVGSRDVVAEGRDLGPGTAAPGMDAPHDAPVEDRRDARDQPFDQHAVTDDAGTDHRTEDEGRWREAEAVSAVGAAGAGVGDAAGDRGRRSDETDYVLREDDHEPVAEGTYAAPADDTQVDGGEQMREAAAIGAMGAAATGAAATDERAHDDHRVGDDHDADDRADGQQAGDDRADEHQADVHSLTSEEIDAGARHEPLATEEQTPGEGPEDDTAGEGSYDSGADYSRASDVDHARTAEAASYDSGTDDSTFSGAGASAAGATAAGADESAHLRRDEDQLDDDATTYRADDGDAVVVEDVVGEPGMQEEHGYHDDTTPVRGDDGPGRSTDTTYPPDTTAAAGERVVANEPLDPGTQGTGAAAGAGAGAAAIGAAGASRADSTYADGDPGTAGSYDDTTYADPDTSRSYGDTTYADTGAGTGTGTAESYGDTGTESYGDTPTEYGDTTTESYGDTGTGAAGGAVFSESVYGPGSADPAEDGSGPEGWAVKGNTGSMLFHTQESPSYDAVRAEVWFESEEAARAAGFAHWDRRRR